MKDWLLVSGVTGFARATADTATAPRPAVASKESVRESMNYSLIQAHRLYTVGPLAWDWAECPVHLAFMPDTDAAGLSLAADKATLARAPA